MITFDDPVQHQPTILPEEERSPAVLKVVGVGGAGCNAINRMIQAGVKGVEFIAVNTDSQALARCLAPIKLQLHTPSSRGRALGAGGNPEEGRAAALDKTDELLELLAGADMVFIAAGMGGGTGTGASPVIGNLARDQGALTVAVVNTPFSFEGEKRMKVAQEGLAELRKAVDTLIVVPNARLEEIAPPNLSFTDAFLMADQALHHGVQGISEIINEAGVINRDFADVKAVLAGGGMALMGIGIASGEHRALEAAQNAVASPLLDGVALQGAQRVLVNFTLGPDACFREVQEAAVWIRQQCSPSCAFFFGYTQREDFGGQIQVTLVATSFDSGETQNASSSQKGKAAGGAVEIVSDHPFFPKGADLANFGVHIRQEDLQVPAYLRQKLD